MDHERDRERLRDGQQVTWVGAGVNAVLIVLKGVAGVLGGSQALIADAVHSLSDFVTDVVVLVGLAVGRQHADEDHHFGHGRYETLACFLVALALILVAIFIGWEAGVAIYAHKVSRPSWLAVGAAAASILSKELLYQYTVRVGQRIRSPAVIANAWHHRSDALSSVAVLVGVAAVKVNPAWHMADSYAALIVSAFVLHVGVGLAHQSIQEFTDAAPDPEVLKQILATAASVEGVQGVHDLRVRTLGGLYQMEIHLEVDGNITVAEGHRIGETVRGRVEAEIGNLARMIFHLDPCDDREPESESGSLPATEEHSRAP